jgi:hypothetical protein
VKSVQSWTFRDIVSLFAIVGDAWWQMPGVGTQSSRGISYWDAAEMFVIRFATYCSLRLGGSSHTPTIEIVVASGLWRIAVLVRNFLASPESDSQRE